MDGKPEVVALVALPEAQMAELEAAFTVRRLWAAPEAEAALDQWGPTARGLVTSGGRGADAALIARLPQLEIIASFGVGFDAIDLDAAAARHIRVSNTPDVLDADVADLAIALTLASMRRLAEGDRYVRAGRWAGGAMPLARSAGGKTLGILGLGRIGKAIARRAAAFDMTILYHGRRPQPDQPYRFVPDLVELARLSDVLVVICPGGAATRNLVDARVLEALGPSGTLVNVARGSVVDEAALVAALQSGRLGAAALDVFAQEPDVPSALLAMDQVVLAPHVGSATVETRAAMAQLVLDNLRAHFAGRPLPTPVL